MAYLSNTQNQDLVAGSTTIPPQDGNRLGIIARANKVLPTWCGLEVSIIGLPTLIYIAYLGFATPAIVWGFLPILVVGPYLWWASKLKSSNRSLLVQAFLSGATYVVCYVFLLQFLEALTMAGFSDNDSLSLQQRFVDSLHQIGISEWFIVIQAPVSEEIVKGLAVLLIVRRYRHVTSTIDVVMIGVAVGLGFAVTENMTYIHAAAVSPDSYDSSVAITVVSRTIFTPFLHPLITACTAFGIGMAITRAKSLWWASIGLVFAIVLHVLNNYIAFDVNESLDIDLTHVVYYGATLLVYPVMFLCYIRMSINDRKLRQTNLPWLINRYSLTAPVNLLFIPALASAHRRKVGRAERSELDRATTALASLTQLHHQSLRNANGTISSYQPTEKELGPHLQYFKRSFTQPIPEFDANSQHVPCAPPMVEEQLTFFQQNQANTSAKTEERSPGPPK